MSIFSGRCDVCGEEGDWPTADARTAWEERHFQDTGHDDCFFEVDRPGIPGPRPVTPDGIAAAVKDSIRRCRCPQPPRGPDDSLITRADCPEHPPIRGNR